MKFRHQNLCPCCDERDFPPAPEPDPIWWVVLGDNGPVAVLTNDPVDKIEGPFDEQSEADEWLNEHFGANR